MDLENIQLEKEAIRKAKRDKEAFEFLYRKYFPKINNLIVLNFNRRSWLFSIYPF